MGPAVTDANLVTVIGGCKKHGERFLYSPNIY